MVEKKKRTGIQTAKTNIWAFLDLQTACQSKNDKDINVKLTQFRFMKFIDINLFIYF